MSSPFTHDREPDSTPNGRKALTRCGVYVRREAIDPRGVTCPVCRDVRDLEAAQDAEHARRATALGITVEELLFGRAEDDPSVVAQWPQVPR
jgi:hypothetical protein